MHQFYSVQLYPAFRQGQIKTFIKNCEEELKEVNSKAHHLGAAWLLQFVYTPSTDTVIWMDYLIANLLWLNLKWHRKTLFKNTAIPSFEYLEHYYALLSGLL